MEDPGLTYHVHVLVIHTHFFGCMEKKIVFQHKKMSACTRKESGVGDAMRPTDIMIRAGECNMYTSTEEGD